MPSTRWSGTPGPSARSFAVLREVGAVDDRHPTELARVREAQDGPVVESDSGANERVVGSTRFAEQQLAGHPQGHDEGLAAIELEHDELAPPSDTGDRAPLQPRREVRRRHRLGDPMPERFERRDAPPDDHLAQLPRDRLDLRKLRHVWRQAA
jgi:hypothetical protein